MQVSGELFIGIVMVLIGFLLGMGVGIVFCKWMPSPIQREEKRRIKKKKKELKVKCRDAPSVEEEERPSSKTLSEKIQDKPSYVNDISRGNCSERVKSKRKEQTKAYQYLKRKDGLS